MTDDWRCFVAVPFSEELRDPLAEAVAGLRDERPELAEGWSWGDPAGWHITLAFLGATPVDDLPRLTDALTSVAADTRPMQLTTGGLGAFPSRRAARVLWYGVHDPERRLRALAGSVRSALELDLASPFRAHLTLGRSRHRHGAPIGDLLDTAVVPSGELAVGRIVLFRSHLGGGRPATYEALAEAPLGVPVGAGSGAASAADSTPDQP